MGLYEAEPQVAALNEDAHSAPRAMADKLISNGCDKCNLFVVWTARAFYARIDLLSCICGFPTPCGALQMDNAKLGELLDETSGDMPFHVRFFYGTLPAVISGCNCLSAEQGHNPVHVCKDAFGDDAPGLAGDGENQCWKMEPVCRSRSIQLEV